MCVVKLKGFVAMWTCVTCMRGCLAYHVVALMPSCICTGGFVRLSPPRQRKSQEDMTDDDWAAEYARVAPNIDGG